MGRKRKWPVGITERTLTDGKKRFQLAFTFRGTPIRKLTELNVNAANAKYLSNLRAVILVEIADGTFQFGKYWPDSKEAQKYDRANSETKLISTLLTEQIAQFRKQKSIEPGTIDTYEINVNNQLIPAFGHLRLVDLTTRHIEEWVRHHSATVSSARTYLIPLKHVCRAAHRYGEIQKNPLADVDYKSLQPKDERIRDDSDSIDPFSMDEVVQIVNNAMPWSKNVIKANFFMGLRPSELICLKWTDIDFGAKTVTIQRAVDHRGVIKRTKTDSTRVIELIPPALSALLEQQKYNQGRSEFVLISRRGTPFPSYRNLHLHWGKVLANCKGIRYRSPYQMRHTFASQMLSNKEDIFWVAHMLGHKDIKTVQQHYYRWIPKPEGEFKTNTDWEKALNSAEKRTEFAHGKTTGIQVDEIITKIH
ncbi:site-specific integrase [Motiliproteus coralliicola]|uniref:Site-specific integrase n=1 Tax=Motiliproteus coralliicola TaxID=2283196 RepID=A0A369WU33_9GAMM|nr:tyrosine-type recombinase/integrase [Motiliproteus coralliicola]RDE25182.1 site-specific integrase [Motiliproteus coralliicola]